MAINGSLNSIAEALVFASENPQELMQYAVLCNLLTCSTP